MSPRAGGGRATIVDVAARAGVSRQTVSRAINDLPGIREDTRQRVLEAAEELHYRPSRFGRGLVSAEPPTLGLLVDDLANAFFPEIARAVIREAAARRWNVVVAETGGAADPAAVGADLARRADALLGYGLPAPAGEAVPARMPLVALDAPAAGAGVVFDDTAALVELAAHLEAAEAGPVAMLDGQGAPGAPEHPSPRAARIRDVLAPRLGEVAIVPTGPGGVPGQLAEAAAREAGTLVCFHDVQALAVLQELRRAGRAVPEDVRVVGVDGLHLGTLVHPELTTLGVDREEVARHALDLVEGLFGGTIAPGSAAARRRVEYGLLRRQSA